jgi:hypothetical protein
VTEYLPSKYQALISNPNTKERKERRKEGGRKAGGREEGKKKKTKDSMSSIQRCLSI